MGEDAEREEFDRLAAGMDFSGMAEAAVSFHTIYESLRKGGFTEDQALRIIAYGLFKGH